MSAALSVFVSSVMGETREEREVARQAILHLRLNPVMFEHMGAMTIEPEQAYMEGVESCDLFLIILVNTISSAVSKEYRHAIELQKPILLYLHESYKQVKNNPDLHRLITKNQKYHRFRSLQELEDRIILDILGELTRKFRSLRAAITMPSGYGSLHPEIGNIIEFSRDGIPNIIVHVDELKVRELVGVLLYVAPPDGVLLRELLIWLSRSWHRRSHGYVSAIINSIRQYVIKEGQPSSYRYRLSKTGKEWVEKVLLPKLLQTK